MSYTFEIRPYGPRPAMPWGVYACAQGHKGRVETYSLNLEGNKVVCLHEDGSRHPMEIIDKGGDWE